MDLISPGTRAQEGDWPFSKEKGNFDFLQSITLSRLEGRCNSDTMHGNAGTLLETRAALGDRQRESRDLSPTIPSN